MKKIERNALLSDIMEKRLYSLKEAAPLLGVSIKSLRRAIDNEKIKSVRVGRFLRIPASEIKKITLGDNIVLTVADAAEYLNISIAHLRNLIKSKKIKAYRWSTKGPWLISKKEIIRLAKEGITE